MITELYEPMLKLKSMLEDTKFEHSIFTMQTAVEFAGKLGIDANSAALAGLLHDCATGLDHEAQIKLLRDNGHEPDEISIACPWLLHGPAGAVIAERDFSVHDKDILSAIWYHTYGRHGMSPLEKLIFIADFIEPSRKIPEVQRQRGPIRDALNSDPDRAAVMTLQSILRHLIETGSPIHGNAIDMLNDLLIRQARNQRGVIA